jgi:drug/metabolite transporter (DMT)-like permease
MPSDAPISPRAAGIRAALVRFSLPALLAQVIWGFSVIALKYCVTELDPYVAGFLRVFVSALILLVALYRQEGSVGMPRHLLPRIFLIGAIGMGVNTILWQNGLARTAASNAALISNASPIFALALAVGIGQEKLVRRRVAGMLVALVGAGLVVGADGLDLGATNALGNLLIVGAIFCWAAYNVFGVPLLRSISPLRVTTWAMIFASGTMAALSPWGVQNWNVGSVGILAWGGLAYAIVLGTVVATTIWSGAVQRIGASAAMVYAYLSPILSVAFAALLLGERIQPIQALGAAFVIAGVTLSQGRRVKAG